MEMFLIGAGTSIITYVFAYSYLNITLKRIFNRVFANGIMDIVITIAILVTIGTNGLGIALLALGLGVGLSISLRAGRLLYGIGEEL